MSRSRRNELIKKQLLDTGVSMFINQGYHGTGIQEVVDKVGIPKGSFYNYFKSKEDFGAEAIIHYSNAFKEFLESIVDKSKENTEEAIGLLFKKLIKLFKDKDCREGCLLGNFAAEISGRSDLGRKVMNQCISEWKDIVVQIILIGQQQGYIKKDLIPDEAADFFLNLLEGSILRMKIVSDTKPLKQMKSTFTNYIMEN